MNDKSPEQVFAELVINFNNYVCAVEEYICVEEKIRKAGLTDLKNSADALGVYIGNDATANEVADGILSTMKSSILNAGLQFRKLIEFKGH